MKTFQRYVARHLHACNSRRFPIFNSQKSNWHFNSQPFFNHNLNINIQMDHASPFQTFMSQELSNGIKKSSIQWVLTPSNCFLKIWDSIKISNPKMGVHLKMCGFILSHSFALPKVWMWFLDCPLGLHLSMHLPWLRTQSVDPKLRLWQ